MPLNQNPLLRAAFRRWPPLQPIMRELYGVLSRRPLPTFVGWEMITWHAVPWARSVPASDFDLRFAEAERAVRHFHRTYDRGADVDALKWRHWNVAYSVRHAQVHTGEEEIIGVECGVADGLTAYFALAVSSGTMHLYDAWSPMRADHLLPSEAFREGDYRDLSLEATRRNLRAFEGRLVWHSGYIPETLNGTAPQALHWLHIDLNSARPTLDALEFFWPRLVRGGVVLFDDYGWVGWSETRKTVDEFFSGKPGTLLPLPTGQALYFR